MHLNEMPTVATLAAVAASQTEMEGIASLVGSIDKTQCLVDAQQQPDSHGSMVSNFARHGLEKIYYCVVTAL